MKFDTAIIGGGLSGLICGIQLQKKGKKCAIVSTGQSALHFSSGAFDLLSYLPDGSEVENIQEGVKKLIEQNPNHPYAKLGEALPNLINSATQLFEELNISFVHGESNHYKITPLGEIKPTWASLDRLATIQEKQQFPWKKVALFNLDGYLDFYPKFIKQGLKDHQVEVNTFGFSLPELDRLRRNPTELRATNISNVLDKESILNKFIAILKSKISNEEVILLPAFLGLKNDNAFKTIEEQTGKPVKVIPTLPPSIIGIKLQQYLQEEFISLGGVYMLGDNVLEADLENNSVQRIYTYNHGDIPIQAKHFVLATGSYFSQGLIATQKEVIEPVFNLDVTFDSDRTKWYNKDVFETQPYLAFGVKTNKELQGLINNQPLNNLYIVGAVLESFNPIKEGSGGGVSILTALAVADKIAKN